MKKIKRNSTKKNKIIYIRGSSEVDFKEFKKDVLIIDLIIGFIIVLPIILGILGMIIYV